MKNVVLYGHGGSNNHGCEALVRTITEIIKNYIQDANVILYSNNPESDYKWGVNEVVNEIRKMPEPSLIARIVRKFKSILKIKNNDINNSIAKKFVKQLKNIDIAVSIGGDNYCYSKDFNYLFYKINNLLHKKNIRTIFFGCSIEEKFIDEEMIEDLNRYDLITVRETLTKENLEKNGVIDNVKLIPDSAFNLKTEKIEFPQIEGKEVIGINISPMILEYEEKENITYKNYFNLVKYILGETNYSVALITHVTNNTGGDYTVNEKLYHDFSEYKDRIILVPEMKAENIKYIISKCKVFIGARTHATIAAYSNCVPTLVVGYSVKARGIAKDLFGTYENYVIPVQNLREESDLVSAFKWIEERKEDIKKELQEKIPSYKSRINDIAEPLKKNVNSKCTVLVCSCDKYESLWTPFFTCLKDNWKDVPYPIVLNTESKSFKMEGLDIRTFNLYKPNGTVAWGKRMKDTLRRISTEYVIILLDDFFLKSQVDQEKINQCMSWMDENKNIAVFSFWRTRGNNIPSDKYEDFELRQRNGEYRFNCQAAIWRRERLIKFIRNHESPWDWELLGSIRSRRYKDEFYSLLEGKKLPFNYDVGGVLHRGKWVLKNIKPIIEKYNLNINLNKFGYQENWDTVIEVKPEKRTLIKKITNRLKLYATRIKSLI